MIVLVGILFALALGGAAFAFTGAETAPRRRVAAVSKTAAARGRGPAPESAAQQRKNVAAMLKDVEKNRAAKKEKPTMRRRLEQAGFPKVTARTYWIVCAALSVAAAFGCYVTRQTPLVIALATFAVGFGFPRWVLGFLTNRRRKKFTSEFAGAIDVIVR
jgi:tight adherence protein B